MTNFEKWKETLKPDLYAKLLGDYCGEMPMGAACPYCPIKDSCEQILYGWECEEAIMKWANLLAKENDE